MKTIILAAGVGNRLGESSENLPKCLLEIGGLSLLRRHIKILEQTGIKEVLIVTGFARDKISKELDNIKSKLSIDMVYNPDYRSGSVVSLWHSSRFLTSGDDIILMDADVLYSPRILQTLVRTNHPNCFLLDRDFQADEEPVKLCIHDGHLIDFRKKIDQDLQYDLQGESVGFFRFCSNMAHKLARQTQNYIDTNRIEEPYEEVIRDLLLQDPDEFAYEDITGYPWIEIDFPEDLTQARQDILIKINMQES